MLTTTVAQKDGNGLDKAVEEAKYRMVSVTREAEPRVCAPSDLR